MLVIVCGVNIVETVVKTNINIFFTSVTVACLCTVVRFVFATVNPSLPFGVGSAYRVNCVVLDTIVKTVVSNIICVIFLTYT